MSITQIHLGIMRVNDMDARCCQAAFILHLEMETIPEVKMNNQGKREEIG